jgi:hypothetical protein
MFSVVYRLPLPRFCSILFHFDIKGLPEFASIGVGLGAGERSFPPIIFSEQA